MALSLGMTYTTDTVIVTGLSSCSCYGIATNENNPHPKHDTHTAIVEQFRTLLPLPPCPSALPKGGRSRGGRQKPKSISASLLPADSWAPQAILM